ncbi:uncharacterized protein LOC105786417 [Gossypium raimondii]|uniref:uncharacterized protein LOC105786417 n=1 Tax=Gossypium raimondii TaxID=29730 RepID=UPI00063AC7F7|nr:uncharacterized protein LOC105786417 [Gossypium raimondii]
MWSVKLLVLFLVAMMVSSSCMTTRPTRAVIGGTYGWREQQRYHVVRKENEVERRNMVEDSSDKNIDNHHNIPRQRFGMMTLGKPKGSPFLLPFDLSPTLSASFE